MKANQFNVQRLVMVVLVAVVTLLGVTSCSDKNSPSGGGSSSYSGYAPDAKGMVGKWLDLGVLIKFRYNGSAWDVAPATSYLENKDFQPVSGQISYTRIDDYSAYLEWNIDYRYTYSGKTVDATFNGRASLDFDSRYGGHWTGYVGSSPYTNKTFTLY